MNRRVAVFSLVTLALAGGLAHAQGYPYSRSPVNANNPFARPRLSPYLNLLRGGSPAANYYLGVLPEIDRRQQEHRVNQQLLDLEQRSAPLSPDVQSLVPTLQETGHPTAFMALTPYFGGSPTATVGTGQLGQTQTSYQRPPSRGRRR